ENDNVVDFHASNESRASKPRVVVAKLERFEDVGEVTKNINEKRIVIINLESASNEVTQRIIDFIYGVTIANRGELKRVAYRTYMVKPQGYDYTGSIDEDTDSHNIDGIFFQ
ncbi:MAG: cell division protein SepF, partial [Clostridia bacterium]|nr:cell division protein SepF [Clostridia bacterium]